MSDYQQLARFVSQAAASYIIPGRAVIRDDGTIVSSDPRFAAIIGLEPHQALGAPVQQFLNPDQKSAFLKLLAAHEPATHDFSLLTPAGMAVTVRLSLRSAQGPDDGQFHITLTDLEALAAVRGAIVAALDNLPAQVELIADTNGADAQAAHDFSAWEPKRLVRKAAQQSAIAAFAERSLETTDMAALADVAVQTTARAFNADVCLIYELQPDGDHLQRGAAVGIKEFPPPGGRYPLADFPMIGRAIAGSEPVVFEDLSVLDFSGTVWSSHFDVTSGICAPIPGKKRLYGAIGAFSRGRMRFTADDIDFIRTIANLYAHALERNESEDDRHRREEYYHSIIEDLSDAISLIEPDGTLTFASASLERILGHKPSARIKRYVFNSHHPDEVENSRKVFAEVVANPGQVRTLECRLRHADGSWRDVELVWRAVTRPEGGLVVVSTMRDITARRRAEREHSLLAAIVESSNDSIISRDLEGHITSWNAGAERLYGFTAGEVMGKRREDFETPAFAARMREQFNEVIQSGRPQRLEARRIRKDGTSIDVSTTISPLFGPDGRIMGITAISRDISERRLAERARELARSNAELEQFAYVASHDLKEPLRVIEVYAQLVRQRLAEFMDSTTSQFLGYIEDGARRGRELIDALLDYARLAPKSAVLTPVDCAAVLNEVRHNLSAAIDASGAHLSHEPEKLPVLMGDRTLFVQLFQNLISNALKFRSDAPPHVHIAVQRRGGEWLFSVRDNGIGIDPRYSERIFDMFQRLYPRRQYPGTGMGLTICKTAVEKLGGKIWVESQPGQGATFLFTVPCDN